MGKTSGQMNICSGVYIQTGRLIGRPGGIGVVLLSPEGDLIKCMVLLDFSTTNNEAEYKALVARLDLAKATGATRVVLYCDSQVVTN